MAADQESAPLESLDADGLTKLELSTNGNGVAILKIFFDSRNKPRLLEFESKKQAIDYYNKLWRERSLNDQDLVEVGDFS